jgi:hypothetical protein
MKRTSTERAFRSWLPFEIAAPLLVFAFCAALAACACTVEKGFYVFVFFLFTIPSLGCVAATALIARKHGRIALAVLASAIIADLFFGRSHDEGLGWLAVVAELVTCAVCLLPMCVTYSAAAVKIADRGDTVLLWSAGWSMLVFGAVGGFFWRGGGLQWSWSAGLAASLLAFAFAVVRSWRRRALVRRAQAGTIAELRVRANPSGEELIALTRLYESWGHDGWAVLERVEASPAGTGLYREAAPGAPTPGVPIGLVPV